MQKSRNSFEQSGVSVNETQQGALISWNSAALQISYLRVRFAQPTVERLAINSTNALLFFAVFSDKIKS
jgi:hypothetical protein